MREKRAVATAFEAVDITQERFDYPILWLLSALLIYMPAAFGAINPSNELLVLAGACGLLVLLAMKLAARPDVPFVWSWSYLPIALFFLLAAIQLVPLPAAWVGAISPQTLSTNRFAFWAICRALYSVLRTFDSVFYQEGAWQDLRKLVVVTSVFIVVVNVFHRAEQMIQLLWVIAWIGAAEGALAVLQILTNANAVLWMFPLWGEMRPEGGTFANHNMFSQFMNLSIGAMLGLLLSKLDQTFRRHDYTPSEVVEKLTSPDFRAAWVLLAMLTVSVASVFLSLSRGGMLSIAVAGVVVGVLLAIRGGARGMGVGGWVGGVVLVAVFSLIMAGGAGLVQGRIAKIGSREDRYDRLRLTKDTLRAWHDYPAVGMGLGSFVFTFPAYDGSNVAAGAAHAEDEYAELLEETGVAGAAIAGGFWLIIFACFVRASARGKRGQDGERGGEGAERLQNPSAMHRSNGGGSRRSGEHRSGEHRSGESRRRSGKKVASPASSLALGLCFGLVAILVQSATDFAQHLLSMACLTAISCALMVNLARLRRRERGFETGPSIVHGSRVLRGGALVVGRARVGSGGLARVAGERSDHCV